MCLNYGRIFLCLNPVHQVDVTLAWSVQRPIQLSTLISIHWFISLSQSYHNDDGRYEF